MNNQPRYKGSLSEKVGKEYEDRGTITLWDNEPEENQPVLTGNLKKIIDGTKKKLLVSLWDNEPEDDNDPNFTGKVQDEDYNQRGEVALWINENAEGNQPKVTGKVTIYKDESEKTYNASLWINENSEE